MERISRQVQQLDVWQRPALRWCLFIWSGLMVHDGSLQNDGMNCSWLLHGEADYLYVIRLNKSSEMPVDTIRPSVWWRKMRHAYGVVPEVTFLEKKLSVCVRCSCCSQLCLLTCTIWPMRWVINNCGWHYCAVVWAICFPAHRSSYEWLLLDLDKQQLDECHSSKGHWMWHFTFDDANISPWHRSQIKQEAVRECKPPPCLVWRAWNSLLKRETV